MPVGVWRDPPASSLAGGSRGGGCVGSRLNVVHGQLPASGAPERKARQVFERAAEQAGFFEHGKNRLVMPGIAAKDIGNEGEKPSDENDGGGGGGGKDPLIAALIQKLPPSGTDWSSDDRVMWLQMISMAFQMAYGQKEPIKITKDAAN